MTEVTVTNDRYTVKPLYQWDNNQDLIITGLSLSSIPEIHFTNDVMDKAIVRQATMDDAGVITARIPNSLLQKPYKIRAYVCIYEGDIFKSLYTIEIPVKARKKPMDYTIENDEEIYSFNALDNKVENALKALYADRADTLRAVEEATNETINTLNSNYATFVKNFEDSNKKTLDKLREELEEKYNKLVDNIQKHIDSMSVMSETTEGTVIVKCLIDGINVDTETPYSVTWVRQGNVMSIYLTLTRPPHSWGTVLFTNYGLKKPDWFVIPDIIPILTVHSNRPTINEYLRLNRTESDLGYVIVGALGSDTSSEESVITYFQGTYIVPSID